VLIADKYAEPRGINLEGLKRRGFDAGRIAAIKQAYRALFVSGKSMADAKRELADSAQSSDDVRRMLEFIEGSDRGLLR
jgi:UDP-N-acetylglucosamine acyltransferase